MNTSGNLAKTMIDSQQKTKARVMSKYDLITFHVPSGMGDEMKSKAEEKSGLAFASYVRELIERDLGIEFGMKAQKADKTGVRHTKKD